jgi:hypothetical protein
VTSITSFPHLNPSFHLLSPPHQYITTQANPITPRDSPRSTAPSGAVTVVRASLEMPLTDAKLNRSTPPSPARCGPSLPPKVSKTVVSCRYDAVGRNNVQIRAMYHLSPMSSGRLSLRNRSQGEKEKVMAVQSGWTRKIGTKITLRLFYILAVDLRFNDPQ